MSVGFTSGRGLGTMDAQFGELASLDAVRQRDRLCVSRLACTTMRVMRGAAAAFPHLRLELRIADRDGGTGVVEHVTEQIGQPHVDRHLDQTCSGQSDGGDIEFRYLTYSP